MEGEFLVEAKEYKLSAIRCMLCVASWVWSVILPWIPLVSVPVALAFILAALHFARYKKEPKWLLRNIEWLRTFYVWLGALAILGGTWAFFLPIAINSGFNKNDDGPVLRQLLIYTTGGLLGAITLGETRRKNDQEHMRQVHAERRSRYAKAIEQLADEKAPIRLGGVYTLAKLVDEWLADEKTLPSEEERHQEGQIIIDSLCAYIRSSFPLAERHDELTLSYEKYKQKCHDKNQEIHSPQRIPLPKPKNAKQSREEFVRDKSFLQEEQEVRKIILSEIKNRLNGGNIKNKYGRDEIKPGTWSYFEYDFSNAVFFYDVEFNEVNFSGKKTSFSATKFIRKTDFSGATFHETHKVTNFSGAHFHESADFSGADFSGAHFHKKSTFSGAHFHESADFSGAHFHESADFSGVDFHEGITFSEAHFSEDAGFSGIHVHGDATFSKVIFHKDVIFSETHFHKGVSFSGTYFSKDDDLSKITVFSMTHFSEDADSSEADFSGAHFYGEGAAFSGAHFHKGANFSGAHFHGEGAAFSEKTDFSGAHFHSIADFSVAHFHGDATFSVAHFHEKVTFHGAQFHEKAFIGAYFYSITTFVMATFEDKPKFEYTLDNKTDKARFSYKAEPKDYNFEVSYDSPYKIETEEQEHNGIKFTIPKGAELFNPDNPSE